ncbi:MAG: hypothetical protein PVF58_06925 [Candidatus Methanofastidiosia archaeon]|jgi:hypothetical protein
MRKGKLIFVDEKECGQVCSTIILSHCNKKSEGEISINIGKTIVQKKDTNFDISLCNPPAVLDHLKILTPSELAINARELMTQLPYIKTSDGKSLDEEDSDIENIFDVAGLVFRNFDIHQGSIVFIRQGKLDIKNLRYDVEKLEVKRLQTEAFERFEVQTVLYGKEVIISNEEGTEKPVGIFPFIYMYIPYILAKTLKERFLHEKNVNVNIDVIGIVSLTENYLCFKRDESRFGDNNEFLQFMHDKIGRNVLNVEKSNMNEDVLKNYLKSLLPSYKKLKKSYIVSGVNPEFLLKALSKKRFDFGIRPIALWMYKSKN